MRSHIRRLLESAGFSPRQLFAAIQGLWAEPLPTNCYQDTAGTTPCTAETTAALMLDRSQGLVLGSENVISPLSGTLGASYSIVGSTIVRNGSTGTAVIGSAGAVTLSNTKTYLVSFTVSNHSGDATGVRCGGGTAYGPFTGNGTFTLRVVGGGTAGLAITFLPWGGGAATATYSNISVRELAGNHALQSVAANRPLLSAKYNLYTATESFSGWTVCSYSANTADMVAPDGTNTACKVTTANSSFGSLIRNGAGSIQPSNSHTLSGYFKKGTHKYVGVSMGVTITGSGTRIPFVDLETLAITTTGVPVESGFSMTATSVGNGWVKIVAKTTAPYAGYKEFALCSDIGRIELSIGVVTAHIWHPDLRLASTPANIPAYQRVNTATDYDTSGFPWRLIHDTTDFLTASLPAINVRRNLLTYSEQFDNAAWVKVGNGSGIAPVVTPNAGLSPDGIATADRVSFNCVGSTASDRSSILYGITVSNNTAHVGSVYVKAFTQGDVGKQLRFFGDAVLPSTIITLSNAWQRVEATRVSLATAVNFGIETRGTFTTNTTAEALIYGAQLELGSVATDYQRVTDWTSEAYSSSGSTYFATPVGMSSIHNQSISQSYNLPALSSDIYGWVITPERLSAVNESKLERYFLRLAGLAGPDYATDAAGDILTADDGTELLLAQ